VQLGNVSTPIIRRITKSHALRADCGDAARLSSVGVTVSASVCATLNSEGDVDHDYTRSSPALAVGRPVGVDARFVASVWHGAGACPRRRIAPNDAPAAPSADASRELVYVDGNGVIRVLDLAFSSQQVQWFSPSDDWRSIALGDFDNDNDKEIVAVRGTPNTSTAPELTIFDPVVARGSVVPGQSINGIPWKQLFNLPLPSRPALVFAGNFDPNVPGDEIGIVRAPVAADDPDGRRSEHGGHLQTDERHP
jgi:hypothetical protein